MTGLDHAAFIRDHTRPGMPPLVPEIMLHLASEITPIWQATEDWLRERGLEPPFWAFAWPGSQALARLVLDNPGLVAGKRVLDFAAGGGLAGIACAQAGAARVEAADIDPLARAAIRMNAEANRTVVTVTEADIVGAAGRWDIVMCGDICYDAGMTAHIMPWLRDLARGAVVWIAEPGRAYRPDTGLARIGVYRVPTSLELEDRTEREVTLYQLVV